MFRQESGLFVNSEDNKKAIITVNGYYEYITPEGIRATVIYYVAVEDGFRHEFPEIPMIGTNQPAGGGFGSGGGVINPSFVEFNKDAPFPSTTETPFQFKKNENGL